MARSMYDIIKKQNGERFAKAIRNYDNGIFEIPGIDKIVKYAGRAAEPIMEYLISLKGLHIEEHAVHMDPIALLARAGYDAYVADTLEKQNAIRKYYAPGEELCTFADPERYKNYFMINAVRKDVDKIHRENFTNPQREDEYGTSVLSIQVLKTGGFISIKNRYNHTVSCPDNTLDSNPDNIIPGLSDAIKHHFGVDFSAQRVALPNGYIMVHGRIVKYDYEHNDIYSCENCYVKTGKLYEIDRNSEIMLGRGLLLNLRDKHVRDITVGDYSAFTMEPTVAELFIEEINAAIAGKKLRVEKNSYGGRDIIADDRVVLSVQDGDLTYVHLPNAKTIYLSGRKHLRGDLDFSGATENLILEYADLGAVTGLKLPRDTKQLHLNGVDFPAVDLDLENMTGNVGVAEADLTAVTSLTLPKEANSIAFTGAKFPALDLDLREIRSKRGSVYFTDADFSAVKSLKLPQNMTKYVTLYGVKMPAGVLDLSDVGSHIDINRADLSAVTELILPTDLEYLVLGNAVMPSIDLDFSGVTRGLNLSSVDLSGVKSLKLPPKHVVLDVRGVKLPAIDLDLSRQGFDLYLTNTDLSRVKSLVLPEHLSSIYLGSAKLPAIDFDFSRLRKEVVLHGADLRAVKSLKLPSGAEKVDLRNAVFPPIDLDLSDVKNCFLTDADFRALKSLRLPQRPGNLSLGGCKIPAIDLDLSHVTGVLILTNTDLSAVKSLKLPSDPSVQIVTFNTKMPVASGFRRGRKNVAEIGNSALLQQQLMQQQGNENE